MKIQIIFILVTILISSTNVEAQVTEWEKGIIGKWAFTDSNNIESTLIKTKEFEMDKPGFAFFENGSFIYHGNSGFCMTKPISFINFLGTWKKIHDEILVTEYKYWNGMKEYKLFVKSVNDNQLIIQFMKDKY